MSPTSAQATLAPLKVSLKKAAWPFILVGERKCLTLKRLGHSQQFKGRAAASNEKIRVDVSQTWQRLRPFPSPVLGESQRIFFFKPALKFHEAAIIIFTLQMSNKLRQSATKQLLTRHRATLSPRPQSASLQHPVLPLSDPSPPPSGPGGCKW